MNVFNLIINDKEQVSLNDIFLDEANRQKFEQLIKEHK
ncbi:MAG TPA: ATPase, partial [Flavobacteriaceae bacterium]|nr:ATPase [Flavobacteriaceae bacterium]